MENHITKEVEQELEEIQKFLEDDHSEEPEYLVERLSILNSLMARTGFLLAVAEADRDRAVREVFEEYQSDILAMPASLAQKFISAKCERENYFAKWLDRLNRDCVHHSDNIRTQVSFAKQNLMLSGRGYN
ncbi:MAG: hypothetical protein IJQ79_03210 [Bacteroidales bacterium]|nr:hypothetical protein [Bacteroidales bacterium]